MKSSLATFGSLALAASPLAAIPLAVPFDVVYPQSAQSDAVVAMQGDRNAGLHDAYNALPPRERITGLTEKRST